MDMHLEYKKRCRDLLKCGYKYQDLNDYDNFKDLMGEEVFKLIIRDKKNRCNKRSRTKTKIKELVVLYSTSKAKRKYLVFGTLTLDDHYLSLKEDTYIRKIHKWLKRHFAVAILNKDFGEKTGREHYHFIGITTEEIEQLFNENGSPKKSKKGYEIYELVKKDYELGFEPTLCKIDLEKNDIDKTTSYLLKLNNHSNKFLAKSRVRVITNDIFKFVVVKEKFK